MSAYGIFMASLYKLTILNDHKIAIGIYQVLFSIVLKDYIDSPLRMTFKLRMTDSAVITDLTEDVLKIVLDKADEFLQVFGLSLSYTVEEEF